MADDLGSQLSVQQQINKVLQKRNALLAQQSKVLGTQIQLAAEYCKALDCADLDGMNDRLGEINASLTQVADDASTSTDETNRLGEAAQQSSDRFGKLAANAKKFAIVAIGFKAIQAGLGGIVQTVSNIASGFMSAVGSVFNFGRSVLSLPFELMGNLIGMAQGGGGGGGNPLKEALEEIRKEMGSLASNEGKAAASALEQFKSQAKDMAGTGLKLSKIFGRGKGGIAKAMKENLESMKALGAEAHFFRGEFEKNAVALSMYRKGLGLSAEDMKGVADTARGTGQEMTGTLQNIASYSVQLGERFNIAAKVIAKDMAGMMKDYEHFGHLGPKVMAQNAVYAQKLGIEIKSLTGMIDKFDNFEDAAKGAAQLSQAFGMNVDAMKMMKEQDPAKRLRMLQDAFQATGRSVKDMTMQEKKLLAQQAGMDVKTIDRAFSQQGLSESYDDIMSAGNDAEKKTLSQAEAMSKLADSIERLTKGGGGGGKKFASFFDAFTQGFGDGIMKHKEFKKVLTNIKESLKHVYTAGKDIGKMFVEMFPGVKMMMKGLQKMFDPKRYQAFMADVKAAFKGLFTAVKSGKDGVPAFIEAIKKAFGKFFNTGSEGAKMFKDGFMAFIKAAGAIFRDLLLYILPEITKGVERLTKWLQDALTKPPQLGKGVKSLGAEFGKLFSALGNMFGVLFAPLLEKMGEAFNNLWTTLKEDYILPWWDKNKLKVGLGIAAIFFPGLLIALLSFGKGLVVTAFTSLFLGDNAKSIFKKVGQGLLKGVKGLGGLLKKGVTKVASGLGVLARKVAPNFTAKIAGGVARVAPKLAGLGARLIPGVGVAAGILLAGKDINAAVDRLDGDLTKKFGETEGRFGSAVAGVANGITLGLLPPDMIDRIGSWTAGVAQKLNSFMDDIGLGGVIRALQEFVRLTIDTVGGLYDIIVGIFTGDSDQVAKGLQRIFDGVVNLLKSLPQAIMDLAALVGKALLWLIKQAFMLVFVYIPKAVLGIVRGIGTALAGLAKFVFNGFKALFADISASGGFGSWLYEKITGLATAAWEGFTSIFSGAWTYFKCWAAGLVQSIWEGWGGEGDVTEPIITFFDAIAYAGEAVVDAILGFFSAIPDFFIAVWDGIVAGAKWMWKWIKKGFTALYEILIWPYVTAWEAITAVYDFIVEGAKSVWAGITEAFGAIKEWFWEKVQAVQMIFAGMWMKVSDLASNAWKSVTNVWNGIKAWFRQKIIDTINTFEHLKKRIGEIAEKAWCFLTAPFRAAAQLGSDIVDGIADGLGGLKDAIICIVKNAWTAVKNFFGISSPSKEGKAAGGFISDGLSDGFAEVEGKIKGTAENALLAIRQVFSGENVVYMLKPVINAFIQSFEFVYTAVGKIFSQGILPQDIHDRTMKAMMHFKLIFKGFAEHIVAPGMRLVGTVIVEGLTNALRTAGDAVISMVGRIMEVLNQQFARFGKSFVVGTSVALRTVQALAEGTGQLTLALERLNRAAPDGNKGLYASVAAVVHNIETLGGVLTGDASDGAVKVVEAFKNGKMTVQHNLPNTKVEVIVHLDKKTLGNELVRTTLSGKQKIATTTG